MNGVVAYASGNYGLMLVTMSFMALDLIVFASVWMSQSSYIERSTQVSLLELLETFDPESVCPFCQVIRLPKSRHCNICNRCVERYDHHCPWINNCVGRTNHSRFYYHLILVLAYCISSVINASFGLGRS